MPSVVICQAICAVRKLVGRYPDVPISSALRGDGLNSLQLTEVSLYVFADCVLIGQPRASAVVAVVVELCVQPRPTVVIHWIVTKKTRTSELTVRDICYQSHRCVYNIDKHVYGQRLIHSQIKL